VQALVDALFLTGCAFPDNQLLHQSGRRFRGVFEETRIELVA